MYRYSDKVLYNSSNNKNIIDYYNTSDCNCQSNTRAVQVLDGSQQKDDFVKLITATVY